MPFTITTLDDINFYVYAYIGLIELVAGTVGNILTVIVLAILNTIYLDFAVSLRVLAGLRRQNDTTFGSDVLCHFFYFVLNGSVSAIMTLLAWIALDRY